VLKAVDSRPVLAGAPGAVGALGGSAFGRGFKVDTAVEQLLWVHSDGPAEARKVETHTHFSHA